jgi:hypothetical protein
MGYEGIVLLADGLQSNDVETYLQIAQYRRWVIYGEEEITVRK